METRLFTSDTKLKKVQSSPFGIIKTYKNINHTFDVPMDDYIMPCGLWYEKNMPINECVKYCYDIKLLNDVFTTVTNPNKNKICVVESVDDANKFCKKYCISDTSFQHNESNNWKKFKEDFAGIEIKYFDEETYFAVNCCYHGESLFWSIKKSCGCIWNVNVIKKIKRIK